MINYNAEYQQNITSDKWEVLQQSKWENVFVTIFGENFRTFNCLLFEYNNA